MPDPIDSQPPKIAYETPDAERPATASPTQPELEREARFGLRLAVSPNERLQALFHPWTSYVVVPLTESELGRLV